MISELNLWGGRNWLDTGKIFSAHFRFLYLGFVGTACICVAATSICLSVHVTITERLCKQRSVATCYVS